MRAPTLDAAASGGRLLAMRSLSPCLAMAIATLAVSAGLAQGPSWQVPPRGAVVYTRTTERFAVDPPPARLRLQWLVAGGEAGGHEWRYFSCPAGRAPASWEQPGFADDQWLLGRGAFGPDAGTQGEQRTRWANDVLLLRSAIDLGRKKAKALVFRIHHDDGVQVFGNGKLLLENNSYGRDRYYVVGGDTLDSLTAGNNLFAVRCVNTGGAQYLDVAMAVLSSLPPGIKTADDLQAAFQAERQAADRVRGDLFGGFRPAGLVLHGELDETRQRSVVPPGDLREIPFWVACDLQRAILGGSYAADVARVYRLGDFQLRGKIGAIDATGWQELDVTVKTGADLASGSDSKRFVSMFVRPHVIYGFDGRLRIRRRLQLVDDQARIAECTCTFDGTFLHGKDWKDPIAELHQVETFRFADVRDNQDAKFRGMVATAIDRGTGYLKQRLGDLKVPLLRTEGDEAQRSYHSGRLALGLLAMIKGGVPKDDPVLTRVLDELRQRPLIDTYSLGNALMVLEAYYAPASEFADIKQGRLDRAQQRVVPASDKALMQRWTTQLLDNVDTRVDSGYLLRFNYVRGDRFDHSVNQYGLLGLYSAHLCGIEVSPTLWEGAANHLVAAQCAPGQPMTLDLIDFRTLARIESDPQQKRTGTLLPTKPAGWSYEEPKSGGENSASWGSMTCAGITGLAIAQAALRDGGVKRFKLQNDADAARTAGFGWLAQHFTARCHPGSIFRQQQWVYYYLYGLERAALLSNVALIQGRDWYFEGAMVLTLAQEDDGSWPAELHPDQDIERAAMAVLFLKKGTVPVLTGQ